MRTGRVDGTGGESKVLQEVLADLKNLFQTAELYLRNQMTKTPNLGLKLKKKKNCESFNVSPFLGKEFRKRGKSLGS